MTAGAQGDPVAANLQDFVPGVGRILHEGQRNDGLFRRACALRRKNFSQEQIERALDIFNRRHCQPPLEAKELQKISASAARYPTGGQDPLETAWARVNGNHPSRYARFVALAGELQASREGFPVALPVARVSELLDCTHQLTSRYRHRAEREGVLTLAERPLGRFVLRLPTQAMRGQESVRDASEVLPQVRQALLHGYGGNGQGTKAILFHNVSGNQPLDQGQKGSK